MGLLNIYEYQTSYHGTGFSNGYLNNWLFWWTITAYNSSIVREVNQLGLNYSDTINQIRGIRPSINLKHNIRIVSCDGTENNPYRLEGDNDTNLNGTKLNTRYSGEYVSFGTGENNLYRIVSHEIEGLTKITSDEPLKENRTFKTISFGDTVYYSNTNTIGSFLNGEYLSSEEYLTEQKVNMIENSTTWYLGSVGNGESYKLAKYTDTNMSGYATSIEAKVGLLRLGELMSGQFDRYGNNTTYWTLTLSDSNHIHNVTLQDSERGSLPSENGGIKPSFNLKSNVIITSGDGTTQNPFQISLE